MSGRIIERYTIDNEGRKVGCNIMRCDCGSKIELWSSWANDCPKCHREYDSGGTLLAPREQWGEETGEIF